MDIIEDNPEYPWVWENILSNPNINLDIIKNNPNEDWNWALICNLRFEIDKEKFIINKYRKYLAAYKIQQWWKKITLSPHTEIGRRFINKKYDELFEI